MLHGKMQAEKRHQLAHHLSCNSYPHPRDKGAPSPGRYIFKKDYRTIRTVWGFRD